MASRSPDFLLDALYEAPLNASSWEAVLTLIAHRFDMQAGSYLVRDTHARDGIGALFGATVGARAELPAEYQAEYWKHDSVRRQLEGSVAGTIVHGQWMREANARLAGEFYPKVGTEPGTGFGSIIFRDGDIVGLLSFSKGKGSRRIFTSAQLRETRGFMAHIQRAARLHWAVMELRLHAQLEENLAANGPHAVLVVDRNCHVAYANNRGADFLRTSHSLCVVDGQLRSTVPRIQAMLEWTIAAATGKANRSGTIPISGEQAGPPRRLLVFPLPLSSSPAGGFISRAFALMVVHGQVPVSPVQIRSLQEYFGLTAAEAMVALLIGQGREPTDVAHAIGVSVHTVRSQLKAIFNKTDTSRQSELVSLLAAFPMHTGSAGAQGITNGQ